MHKRLENYAASLDAAKAIEPRFDFFESTYEDIALDLATPKLSPTKTPKAIVNVTAPATAKLADKAEKDKKTGPTGATESIKKEAPIKAAAAPAAASASAAPTTAPATSADKKSQLDKASSADSTSSPDKESSNVFLEKIQTFSKQESTEDFRLDRLHEWLSGETKIDANTMLTDIKIMLTERQPYRFRPTIAGELTDFLGDLQATLTSLPNKSASFTDTKEAERLKVLIKKRSLIILQHHASEMFAEVEEENNGEDKTARAEAKKCDTYMQLAANILAAMLRQNNRKLIDPKIDNQQLFHDDKPHGQSVTQLLTAIVTSLKHARNAKHTPSLFPEKPFDIFINPNYFILMLLYIQRYFSAHPKIFLNPHNMRNIVITGFSIAYAMLEDNCASDIGSIIKLENAFDKQAAFLDAMNWNAHVSESEYTHFKNALALRFIQNAFKVNELNENIHYAITSSDKGQYLLVKLSVSHKQKAPLIKKLFPPGVSTWHLLAGVDFAFNIDKVLEMPAILPPAPTQHAMPRARFY